MGSAATQPGMSAVMVFLVPMRVGMHTGNSINVWFLLWKRIYLSGLLRRRFAPKSLHLKDKSAFCGSEQTLSDEFFLVKVKISNERTPAGADP
ncbi:hypothetical protein JHL22_00565 [Advenella sp. WQ 585]|uniref:Uncharacterized protein n=1 Tax=Advenella mandrilli TaxID=2800330 RepID=A0ABS1E9Y3_9BURK|nr:hypothetical protein [Advenella mandrilli]MBK1779703.1 hypothetical protein [Advenella mandrilli]